MRQVEHAIGDQLRSAVGMHVAQPDRDVGLRGGRRISAPRLRRADDVDRLVELRLVEAYRQCVVGALVAGQFRAEGEGKIFAAGKAAALRRSNDGRLAVASGISFDRSAS